MSLVVDHPAYARDFFVVDTGRDLGLSEIGIGDQGVKNPMKWAMKRLPLEMTLRPSLHARVKVTDAAGKSVTKGTVASSEGGGFNTASLSADGKARIGLAKPGKNNFRFTGDPLDPSLS